MEPKIQYAKTEDDVNIAYTDSGDGQPLVVLSVFTTAHVQRGRDRFPNIFEPLAQGFRLINYDHRGGGLSDRDVTDFSMEAMMRDFVAIVERTNPPSFAVLAFQSSVPIALTYAASFPDRVSHLILVDGWAKSSDVAVMPAAEASEALKDTDWTLLTETLARVLIGFDDPKIVEGFGEYIRGCIEPEAYRAFVVALRSWDVGDMLSKVTAQTLVLHNNNATFVPISAGRELAAGIPSARFLTIDDLNYEGVASLVGDFVGVKVGQPDTVAQPATPGGLVTILFTDMEGSTTLADQLGDAAAQEVRRVHNNIVRAALSANGGSEVKHTGDGIMGSFSTASSGLDAAIAIQRGVAAHKEEHPDSPLSVYVGINAGEPIAEDDDLFGASINLAARLVDHAQPGQIVASDVVRQLAAGKDFLFADLGETELRGFEDPVKLWELRWQKD